MKKLKIAGYQGDGSVHTRSVKFFIDKVSDYFDISFDQDITEKGQKAASLIEMTMNNEIQMSYLWSSYYEKYIPEIKLLDLPFYFKNKNEVKNLIKATSGLFFEALSNVELASQGDEINIKFDVINRSPYPIRLEKIQLNEIEIDIDDSLDDIDEYDMDNDFDSFEDGF